ncbi:MAG: hypothetical protein J6J24_02980 [Clostridia bacterium]|nr:hypothetical protein [Clostridia bacterium]
MVSIKNFLQQLHSLNTQEENLKQALEATKQRKQWLFDQVNKEKTFHITLGEVIDGFEENLIDCNLMFDANIPTIGNMYDGDDKSLSNFRKAKLIEFMQAERDYAHCFFSNLKFNFTNKDGITSSFEIPFDPNIKTSFGPCFSDLIAYHSDATSCKGTTFDKISIDIDGEYARHLVLPITPEIVANIKTKKVENAIISAAIKKEEKQLRLLEGKKDIEITK